MTLDKKDEEMLTALKQAQEEPWEEVEGKQEKLKLLHRKIGQAQGFNLMNLTARIAAVQIIKDIHDSKLYKLEYATFEDFCQEHFGVGRQSIFDDFKILVNLGIAFCRYGDMIGFSYRTIRRISRLSDDKKVAIGDNYLRIGDDVLELIPENKKEIEETVAELEMRIQAEKRRANGLKKVANHREEKAKKLEKELEHIKNPNPPESKIRQLAKIADDSITTGLDRLNGAIRLILEKEKEINERAPERDEFEILIERIDKIFPQAIKQAREVLRQCRELERIRNEAEKEGLSLRDLPEE